MADEYVELDEEGSPTGRKFGGDDDGKTDMQEFTEVDESDLETRARAKEATQRAGKKARKLGKKLGMASRKAGKKAQEVSSEVAQELEEYDPSEEEFGNQLYGDAEDPFGGTMDVEEGFGAGRDFREDELL